MKRFLKFGVMLIVICFTIASCKKKESEPPSYPESLKISACDDAYVLSDYPDMNFGDDAALYTTAPGYETYLRFDIRNVDKNTLSMIEGVELRIITGDNSTTSKPIAQTRIYGVSNIPWLEELITYNTKPAHSVNPIGAKSNITFDIIALQQFRVTDDFLVCIQSQNYYSLMVQSFSPSEPSHCYYYSKDLYLKWPEVGDMYNPTLFIKYKSK